MYILYSTFLSRCSPPPCVLLLPLFPTGYTFTNILGNICTFSVKQMVYYLSINIDIIISFPTVYWQLFERVLLIKIFNAQWCTVKTSQDKTSSDIMSLGQNVLGWEFTHRFFKQFARFLWAKKHFACEKERIDPFALLSWATNFLSKLLVFCERFTRITSKLLTWLFCKE